MNQQRTVVLDSEAVAALRAPGHRKHRRALAIIEAVNARDRRRAGPVHAVVVPTAVRVEIGWNRRDRTAAVINRLRLDDVALGGPAADRAATLRAYLGVSVADAHLGATITATPGPHAVVTSDVPDMQRIIDYLDAAATIVHL